MWLPVHGRRKSFQDEAKTDDLLMQWGTGQTEDEDFRGSSPSARERDG